MVVGSFQRGNHQRAPVLTAGCSYFLVDDAEGQTFASHTSRTSGLPCWIIKLALYEVDFTFLSSRQHFPFMYDSFFDVLDLFLDFIHTCLQLYD